MSANWRLIGLRASARLRSSSPKAPDARPTVHSGAAGRAVAQ